MIFLKRCKFCIRRGDKRLKFGVKRQFITLPNGEKALSRDEMCGKCKKIIEEATRIK